MAHCFVIPIAKRRFCEVQGPTFFDSYQTKFVYDFQWRTSFGAYRQKAIFVNSSAPRFLIRILLLVCVMADELAVAVVRLCDGLASGLDICRVTWLVVWRVAWLVLWLVV